MVSEPEAMLGSVTASNNAIRHVSFARHVSREGSDAFPHVTHISQHLPYSAIKLRAQNVARGCPALCKLTNLAITNSQGSLDWSQESPGVTESQTAQPSHNLFGND